MKELLVIPMYRLLSTQKIEDINYNNQDVLFFRRDYSLDERKQQLDSLQWAINNPSYDFKGISPILKDKKFSNDEILTYFKKIYNFMIDNDLAVE